MNKPEPFILHIWDSINYILEYTHNLTFQEYSQDERTQDAVIRQLEVIGEASTNLSNTFRQSKPDIPWKQIIATRNKLTHE